MKNNRWSKNQESEFKEIIRKFFDAKISEALKEAKNPLQALTSGKIKNALGKEFVNKVGRRGVRDYKPDIDIVLVRTDLNNKPVVIISVKTTLAERIMQTINWSRYLKIPIILVTAWETFESGTNRERVQELDGVYACNTRVKEYRKIKRFSRIAEDLAKFTR